RIPSPLKSATATDKGKGPTPYRRGARKPDNARGVIRTKRASAVSANLTPGCCHTGLRLTLLLMLVRFVWRRAQNHITLVLVLMRSALYKGDGHRPGRADEPPGRCRAGEELAWPQTLTGRLLYRYYPIPVGR